MITFFSNFFNDHQLALCEAFYRQTNGEFRFVETQPISEERLKLGFEDKSERYPFIVKTHRSAAEEAEAIRLGLESDVVIIGDAPDRYIDERLRQNKLTFRYWERFFKLGKWRLLDPRVFRFHYRLSMRYRKKNLHILCASAYTAPDCRFIRSYPNKTYRWGYFPAVKRYDSIGNVIAGKQPNSLLWVGRFLDWKHPEAAVALAVRLKKEGADFTLSMIGTGAEEEKIKRMIAQNDLADRVHLLGTMTPEEVRRHMEESEIFLFTSDRNEGWGAVMNESMNSGCTVVASRAIGSVPYLVQDGENGMSYRYGDHKDLYQKVKYLLDHSEERKRMGKAAYKTMTEVWNADTAVERFLSLVEAIKQGKASPFTTGPCSKD